MPTIIMDSCNYTRLGLSDYMSSKGELRRKILLLHLTLSNYSKDVSS